MRAALTGLSLYSLRQVSTVCRVSVSVVNQWASRHSARKVPLNDCTKALSVDFPGREKAIRRAAGHVY